MRYSMDRVLGLHAAASALAFVLVMSFWGASVLAKVFCSAEAVAALKDGIVLALPVLIACLAVARLTGRHLVSEGNGVSDGRKARRLRWAAMNGVLVLVPCAFYLSWIDASGVDSREFMFVQMVELAAGALNMLWLGANARDGLRSSGRLASTSINQNGF